MSSAWFCGDYQPGENPLAFLTNFETALAQLPHLSEAEKCKQFYNHCKPDFEAEDWYEDLECNSLTVVASWSTLVLHFRVKWLRAAPDTLLEIPNTKPVTTTQLDAATTVSRETNTTITTTTTTTIPAHTNAAVPIIFETTATPKQLDQEVDA